MTALLRALRLAPGARVAIVGAGGKTTLLFALARALAGPVFVTTTTHLGQWQAALADSHCIWHEAERRWAFQPPPQGVTLFSGAPGTDDRLAGLAGEALDALRSLAGQTRATLLIEADGSRQRPLKAPAVHEPVIPDWVDTVIVVAGLSGLGQPLDERAVHRPERFAALAGIQPGDPVTGEALARVLQSADGGRKGIPPGARVAAVLNQASTPALVEQGLRIANDLVQQYAVALVTDLQAQVVHACVEQVAGVILAAGGAARFGAPKTLLSWRGKPLVRHAADAALAAGLAPVIVVLGAEIEPVQAAMAGLPVQWVVNPSWQAGQGTSLRAALQALPATAGAAVFLLADQPLQPPVLIRALVAARQQTLAPVVAPRVGGRRGNPVLFGHETFADLQAVQGDQGGRAVFQKFPPVFVDWPDPRILLDIDTPEDYQALQQWEGEP